MRDDVTPGDGDYAPAVAGTQAVYYRDDHGSEPVRKFTDGLSPKRAAKIDAYIEEYLSGQERGAPPPEFPITSQIEDGLRELRVRFANTRYRVLYQRSDDLIVLLHAFEKRTGAVPAVEKDLAKRRMADFESWMNAKPRKPPRAAGHDAPRRRRVRD